MSETCERTMFSDNRDVSGRPCGRTAVDRAESMGRPTWRCQIHKGADERADKRRAAWLVKYAEERKDWDRQSELNARFETLGIKPVGFHHKIALHFDLESAEKILAALEVKP